MESHPRRKNAAAYVTNFIKGLHSHTSMHAHTHSHTCAWKREIFNPRNTITNQVFTHSLSLSPCQEAGDGVVRQQGDMKLGGGKLVQVQHHQVQGGVEDKARSEDSDKNSCLHMQTPEDEKEKERQEVNC